MLDGNVLKSKYPINYHITPIKGLLNDPNGLIQFKGKYHVFYQWNPTGTTHESKVWGHVVSEDMIHWQRRPAALVPSEEYDKDGIYSGSAVVKEEKLYVFYTGNVVEKDGTKKSYQCLAISEDGETFEKQGPVLPHPTGYTRHVRDPKVWFDDRQNQWYLLIGAQTSDKLGTALLYFSKDLLNWQRLGELFSEKEYVKLSQRGFMWECPDFFTLDENEFFLFSPQGFEAEGDCYQNLYQSVYLKTAQSPEGFIIEDSNLYELDWGFEFYAPQTFLVEDGRRILYGWMGVMSPEQEQAVPTVEEGWLHHLTIPRELGTRNGLLTQYPVAELGRLRAGKSDFELKNNWRYKSSSPSLELLLYFDAADDFVLTLKNSTLLTYHHDKKQLVLSRKNWLNHCDEHRKTALTEPLTELRLFIDGSSLEVFVNQGESTASARFFEEGEFVIYYEGENDGRAVIYQLELGDD